MAEKRRLNLSLNLSASHQREAWRRIRSIPPGQRTDAVCRMICEAKTQAELLETVRKAIREELGGTSITKKEQQPEDADAGVLGFLLSLQGDDAPDPLL